MKRAIALALAVVSAAAPAMAKPWMYKGEPRVWFWKIGTHADGNHWLTVHSKNSREVAPGRLRVEFSIRTEDSRTQTTYNPYTLYNEITRCDGNKVCNPPLQPVVGYTVPVQKQVGPRWFVHSMTINCRWGGQIEYRSGANKRVLDAREICNYLKVG